jgi:adenosylhomocysteine nucleosidase
MSLAVVTGLAAEARIAVASHVTMIVGAGRARRLALDLEAAIARGARRLLSFGIAGALDPHLRAGDLVVARGVRDASRWLCCDPAWRTAIARRLASAELSDWQDVGAPSPVEGESEQPKHCGIFRFDSTGLWRPVVHTDRPSPVVDIVGVDAAVATAAGKRALSFATGAAAVDMESAIVARAAQRHGLPFVVIRVIADPAHRPLPSAALVAMREDGEIDLAAVFRAVMRDPSQLPALVRLGQDSKKAFSALVRAREWLGSDFASGDLSEVPQSAMIKTGQGSRHLKESQFITKAGGPAIATSLDIREALA